MVQGGWEKKSLLPSHAFTGFQVSTEETPIFPQGSPGRNISSLWVSHWCVYSTSCPCSLKKKKDPHNHPTSVAHANSCLFNLYNLSATHKRLQALMPASFAHPQP